MYSNDEYWIGEYEDHTCERGIAKFMNCATPGEEAKSNCELVPSTRDSKKWLAAKVTEIDVQEDEQLFTMCGGRKVVSTKYVARECPVDLRHTIQKAVELSPPPLQQMGCQIWSITAIRQIENVKLNANYGDQC